MGGWLGGWVVGWLENWRVIPISAFNYVIVEVVAEIGKTHLVLFCSVKTARSLNIVPGIDIQTRQMFLLRKIISLTKVLGKTVSWDVIYCTILNFSLKILKILFSNLNSPFSLLQTSQFHG